MIDLADRLELFVDHHLIDSLNGTTLRLHPPTPANVALTFDQPWEGAFVGYSTVIPDGDRVLLYYRGWPLVHGDACYCYAESTDGGLTFQRPTLGLRDWPGSADNNTFLYNEPGVHNFAPFLDTRPGVDPAQRFKALGSNYGDGCTRGLVAFASPDGIHWQLIQPEPVMTKGAFDSQNVSFWSETEGCYVTYYRTWDAALDPVEFKGKRTVSRATSPDYLTWTDPVQMDYGPTPREELYTNQTFPYFRAPHLYLSFPKRFNPGRRVLTDAEIAASGIIPKYAEEISDGVFMTTRGGNRYDRTFMEGYLRPGLERANWCSRTNMASQGLVQTGPDELSLYYHHRYAQPAQYLRRYTLRLDGFASVNAPYAGGEFVTKPFTFTGRQFVLNYATSGAGSIAIELQDEHGAPIPGFALGDFPELYGDQTARPVAWRDTPDLAPLAGTPVRLRFLMRDADLYSLRFAP